MSESTLNRSVVEEPAMVTGFISTEAQDQLRRLAASMGCSESYLVSEFVNEGLYNKLRMPRVMMAHALPQEPL
jgi:hypothetical protein